jgi:hypothetical protein
MSQKKKEEKEESVEICPKCGSSNLAFNPLPQFSIKRCKDCAYEGPVIKANQKDIKKIREKLKKRK